MSATPAPVSVVATLAAPKKIDITWANPVTYSVLEIERSKDGGAFAALYQLGAGANSYSDTTVQDGALYAYRLRGEKDDIMSEYSSTVSATTPLTAPSGLSGIGAPTEATVNYDDNSQSETGFEIWMDGALIHTTAANVKTYTKTGLNPAETHAFKVRAVNATTQSAFTPTINIFTADPPACPTMLTPTVTATTKIRNNWIDNSSNETGFKIERSEISATAGFALVATLGAGVTTDEDDSLTSNKQYWYRSYAYNASGNSGYSNVVTATTWAAISRPSNLTVTAAKVNGAYGVECRFNDNSELEDSHILERGTGTFAGDAVTNGDFESWYDTPAHPSDWYENDLGGSTVNQDAADKHGGSYSCRLDINADGDTFQLGQAIALLPGEGRRVSFWYKTQAGKTACWLLRDGGLGDTGGASLGSDGLWRVVTNGWQILPTATVWTQVIIEFQAHSAYSGYTLWLGHAAGFSSAASSSIWFDDIKVEAGVFGTTVATLAPNRTYFHDTDASAGQTLRYRVRAKQGAGTYSAYSNEAVITVPAVPAAVADLAVSEYQDEWVRLTWTKSSGEVGQIIEQSDDEGSTWAEVLRIGAGIEEIKVFGLTAVTPYQWRISAYNGAGTSAASAAVSQTTRAAYLPSKFERLIRRENPKLGYLVEVNPAMPLQGWALTSGQTSTYETAFDEYGAVLTEVHANGVALTAKTSIATVEATAGTWWHDTATKKVYVHMADGTDPINYTIIGGFWLWMTTRKKGASKGVWNGNNYLPLVAADGIPDITQAIQKYYIGATAVSAGTINLINGKVRKAHSFDRRFGRYLWLNRKARILAGGELVE
ncbi:MAG: fibronectin type III domain-containing protein [Candidatus Aminicenantales bacterium]